MIIFIPSARPLSRCCPGELGRRAQGSGPRSARRPLGERRTALPADAFHRCLASRRHTAATRQRGSCRPCPCLAAAACARCPCGCVTAVPPPCPRRALRSARCKPLAQPASRRLLWQRLTWRHQPASSLAPPALLRAGERGGRDPRVASCAPLPALPKRGCGWDLVSCSGFVSPPSDC